MAINEAGKAYIAENFGVGNCFVPSGLTWTAVAVDGTTVDESGGTYSIVARLVTTSIYQEIRLKTPRIGTYTYAMLKAANGDVDITLPDAKTVIADYDEGVEQYCYSLVAFDVTFNSLPAGAAGAAIFVGGVDTGSVTPATISLLEGAHRVTLKKSGYQDYTQTISVTAVASYTWTLVIITGVATLWIGTDPGGAGAWIDADPDIEPLTLVTKDASLPGGVDSYELSAPAKHTVVIRKEGYEDYVDNHGDIDVQEGENWYVIVPLTPVVGADVALLTVTAHKAEAPTVPVPNAALKRGTMLVGFVPYEDYWVAPVGGKAYSISLVAAGRATHEETITLYKDMPKTVEVLMEEEKLEVKIRIAEGVAYIDDIAGGKYQTWYVGTKVDGWVRVETFMVEPTLFKAELTFCELGTQIPVPGIPVIATEAKMLHPVMTATERHLNWAGWVVPDKAGSYSLVSKLLYEL